MTSRNLSLAVQSFFMCLVDNHARSSLQLIVPELLVLSSCPQSVEDDFVDMRKDDPQSISAEDLHRMLVVARWVLCLCCPYYLEIGFWQTESNSS